MLKKRIIPCLDVKDGRTVKGVNFLTLRDAGDPVELAKKYAADGADELVFLDITATLEKRDTLVELVKQVAQEINIPFTVGGGINSLKTAKEIILAGAEKVSINSSAVKTPKLITQLANEFGNQCVVVAIDAKLIDENWMVFVAGGTKPTGLNAIEWAKQVEQHGAGELLITAMNQDGTKAGFAIDLYQKIGEAVNLPIIASGGAGKKEHFTEVFTKSPVNAALAASIFHFNEISIPELKHFLKTENIAIR